jgi:hypothetical protein
MLGGPVRERLALTRCHSPGTRLVARVHHRPQQSGKAGLHVVTTEGHPAVATVTASLGEARFAEHAEVMGEGGLGDLEIEAPAGALATRTELVNDRQACGIAQCVEHGGQLELFARGVAGLSHERGVISRPRRQC